MSTRRLGLFLTFDQDFYSLDSFKHLSIATGPIITKFHIEPPEAFGTKICSNNPGHMTNIAAMPIYVTV